MPSTVVDVVPVVTFSARSWPNCTIAPSGRPSRRAGRRVGLVVLEVEQERSRCPSVPDASMMPLDSSSIVEAGCGRARGEDRRIGLATTPRSPVSIVVGDDPREVVVAARVLLDRAGCPRRRCRCCRACSGTGASLPSSSSSSVPPSSGCWRSSYSSLQSRRRHVTDAGEPGTACPRWSRSRTCPGARVECAVLDAVERQAVGDRLVVLALRRRRPTRRP